MVFDTNVYEQFENAIKEKAASGDSDAEEDLQYVKQTVLACAEYVHRVTEEQIEVRLARGVLSGNELREVVEHFDATRHAAHERAIVHVCMLNRMAAAYGFGRIYLGDESIRREIGNFCGEFVSWFFVNRS